ncbi:hypothetical protein N7539_001501 [Penicillium diatomitis]|uniref:Myb-like domain-containing protein n=1 Tax=Penicillium diatomitis TaxID=2819901 RepID=A0A9W9XHR1_9EURO|nr:uncharacterized protein N7539_001501 [Penicillium diatomitis]KAJ5492755.1 hypothetical protein N7539_001501 [Penicillium diatomitis]
MSRCPPTSQSSEDLQNYYESTVPQWTNVETDFAAPPEYRYNINDGLQPQGLGITAPFPSEYPRTSAPISNYAFAPSDHQYAMGYGPTISPSLPPPKRVKRSASDARGPSRNPSTPLNILPDPEGVERLQRERSYSTPGTAPMPSKPRAPGRGRRDPKAEEEDAFVEELRDKGTAWKKVREKFYERFNNDASEARLQMRLLRRRKERLARWEEQDVRLLLSASDMWKIEKYDFIAKKMKELGSTKEYTPEQCRAQLRYIEVKQRNAKSGSNSPSTTSDEAESPFEGPSEPRKRKFYELEG